MANKKLSQINSGTSVAYARATDTPVGVRSGTTDALLSGMMEQAPPPVACGSTLAVTAAMSGQPILLDIAAGSKATLPVASGSGNVYRFLVKTSATSNAHKILANSVSDFLIGTVAGGQSAGAADIFNSPAATNHSIQMPFTGTQPSGGKAGDWFMFTDIAANLWHVSGAFTSGTTVTTPFSTATT